MYTILLVIHTIIVVFLILMVLIQRSDSDGMSGLGGGGNQFLTGRGQANLMTRTTAFLAGAFFITSLTLAIMGSRMGSSSIIDSAVVEKAAEQPATAPAKTDAKAAPKEKAKEPAKPAAPAVPKPE
ncbi:MAG: preprotein translocase subunit SecG [Alphaproteobacteria bacterium]|nr:preprotein translocase subunit SecG [Alphaproteobacteria bacterium]